MFKIIAITAVALIAAVLVLAASKSDTFRVQRSATIKAPPEKIFPIINDLHKWAWWSPWEKMDLDMKRTYSGAQQGTGAAYAWDGNKDVGQGRMEIVESTPPSKIVIKLDFVKPFEAHNVAEFTLEPKGGSTTVTWAMRGANTFMGKVIQVFMSMDSMIGTQFESGLVNLRTMAEA